MFLLFVPLLVFSIRFLLDLASSLANTRLPAPFTWTLSDLVNYSHGKEYNVQYDNTYELKEQIFDTECPDWIPGIIEKHITLAN